MVLKNDGKAKNMKATMKKLSKYIGIHKITVLIVFLSSIIASVFRAINPKLLGDATNIIYLGLENSIGQENITIDFQNIKFYVILIVSFSMLSFIFAMLQTVCMTKIANSVTYKLRVDIAKKINRLPLNYYDTNSTGDILSRISNDIDSLNNSLKQTITQFSSAITLIIITIAMMLFISFNLTMIAFLVIPATVFVIAKVIKISQPLYRKQQRSLGMLNGHVEEMFSAHTIVKTFNMEEKNLNKFDVFNVELYKSAWRSQFSSNVVMPIAGLISNVGYVLVCIYGAVLVSSKTLLIGDITAFIEYIRNFNNPLQQLGNITTLFQSAIACSERIFEFLEQDEETLDCVDFKETYNLKGDISFDDVSFGYNPENIVINDFSLDVKAGEKIAIVGPTGAGKTTLIKILMRYYELNKGSIKIDGIDITEFKRSDLRRAFGVVLQSTWLFKGTVKENICYGNNKISMEDIIKASKICQCHHFISTLPGGYDFLLNEDSSNISQGQKQLITIARAFLQDPKILILDEATSSVDTRTEVMIQSATAKLMENRTTFIIAHRLSTIRDADKIIVMKDGEIIETGSHDELIKKEGFYFNLHKSQFEEA